MGSGYDLSVSTLSPDGRVFQVEYAQKASDNGPTVCGIVCADGVVLAVSRFLQSPMVVPQSTQQIFAIDTHIVAAIAGRIPDGRAIISIARSEAKNFREVWGEAIKPKVLVERIALWVHAYTLAWSERPFGATVLVAGVDPAGCVSSTDPLQQVYPLLRNKSANKSTTGGPPPELWVVDCAGSFYRFFGTAVGKGRILAKTELEKIDRETTTCAEVRFPLVKMLYKVVDDAAAERLMEIELASLRPTGQSGFAVEFAARQDIEDICARAKAALAAEDNEEPDPSAVPAAAPAEEMRD